MFSDVAEWWHCHAGKQIKYFKVKMIFFIPLQFFHLLQIGKHWSKVMFNAFHDVNEKEFNIFLYL